MPVWQLPPSLQRRPRQTQTQLNLEAGAEDGWLNFRLIVFFPLSLRTTIARLYVVLWRGARRAARPQTLRAPLSLDDSVTRFGLSEGGY